MKYLILIFLVGCSSMSYNKTVAHVDRDRFMGKWYVIAARATFLEKGAHNSVEIYKWNEKDQRIDIDFTFRKDGFDGKLKSIPQKAWIINKETNAQWKVQPFWPLKFDYLVVDMDPDYQWVVIGVPNQNYAWIMARDWKMADAQYDLIIKSLQDKQYQVEGIEKVPQQW